MLGLSTGGISVTDQAAAEGSTSVKEAEAGGTARYSFVSKTMKQRGHMGWPYAKRKMLQAGDTYSLTSYCWLGALSGARCTS
jgi:hypothetical protein